MGEDKICEPEWKKLMPIQLTDLSASILCCMRLCIEVGTVSAKY